MLATCCVWEPHFRTLDAMMSIFQLQLHMLHILHCQKVAPTFTAQSELRRAAVCKRRLKCCRKESGEGDSK